MSFRKGILANAIERDVRIRGLVVEMIPTYSALVAVGERAGEMLAEVERADSEDSLPLPTTVDEVTSKWLDAEVDRRMATAQREARADVLRSLVSSSASDADNLLHKHTDEILTGLGAQLDELMDRAGALVAAMDAGGEQVRTAADAISADVAAQWRDLTDLVSPYASIRAAQRIVISAMEGSFDRIACGDTKLVTDGDARLYFFRSIETVAPGWRSGEPVRWPADPVERLAWLVRNDIGPWVPTPADIEELSTGVDLDIPSMIPRSVVTAGRRVPAVYDRNGRRRTQVDLSGHGFDTAGRGRAKPLSKTKVESVSSSYAEDDD